MISKRVTHVQKDSDGDITYIGNPAEWGKISKSQAINEIEGMICKYYTYEESYKSDVVVYSVSGRKHLKTNADRTSKNNLDNLPTF